MGLSHVHGLGNRNCVLEGGLTNIRQNFRPSDSQPRPGASQGDTLQASPEGSSVATALGNPPHGHITHSVKARAEVSSSRTDGESEKRAGGEGTVYKTNYILERKGGQGRRWWMFYLEGKRVTVKEKPQRLWLSRKHLKDE